MALLAVFFAKIRTHMVRIWLFLVQPSMPPRYFGYQKSAYLSITQYTDQSGTKKSRFANVPFPPPTEGQIGGFPHSIFVFRFDLSILILFNSDFLIWFDFVIRFDPAHTAHILLAFFIWFRYYDSIWLIVSGLICLSVYDSICPIFPVWFNWDYKNLTSHFLLYIFKLNSNHNFQSNSTQNLWFNLTQHFRFYLAHTAHIWLAFPNSTWLLWFNLTQHFWLNYTQIIIPYLSALW